MLVFDLVRKFGGAVLTGLYTHTEWVPLTSHVLVNLSLRKFSDYLQGYSHVLISEGRETNENLGNLFVKPQKLTGGFRRECSTPCVASFMY